MQEQIQNGNLFYKNEEQNQQNTLNGFRYPTHNIYGRPMNMNTSLPLKSEIDQNMNTPLPSESEIKKYYNNNKEVAYIDQGNIYENQGYHYKGDIYGNNKRFNNEDKKKENNKKETKNDSQITLNIYKKPGERKYW